MAPSLAAAVTSAVFFSATAYAQSYQLSETYDKSNFLEKFDLFVSDHTTGDYNDVDPTSGFVTYESQEKAEELGILKTTDNGFFLGVDSENKLDPKGIGRSSVRLESNKKYHKGLFIADFAHFPKPTCGVWPAFWTVGMPWPKGGEIDIYEAWNLDDASRIVMHTDASVGTCGIDGKDMTAEMSKPNCAGDAPGQGSGEGCAAFDSSAPYGSDQGGIYALQWTDDAIKIWAFTHDEAPADIAENPNPDNWGTPRFRSGDCEASKVFDEAQLIMNINFCGVAGDEGHWDQCEKETQTTCHAYIAENPDKLKDVYYEVSSIKIYELGDGNGGDKEESGDKDKEGDKEKEDDKEEGGDKEEDEETSEPQPSDEEGMTTLTVDVTQVETITSCAPTVVDCPAATESVAPEDLITTVVTNTVRLTETVCPVTEAEKISSSVVDEYETGDLPGVTLTPEPSAPAESTPVEEDVPEPTGEQPPSYDQPEEGGDVPDEETPCEGGEDCEGGNEGQEDEADDDVPDYKPCNPDDSDMPCGEEDQEEEGDDYEETPEDCTSAGDVPPEETPDVPPPPPAEESDVSPPPPVESVEIPPPEEDYPAPPPQESEAAPPPPPEESVEVPPPAEESDASPPPPEESVEVPPPEEDYPAPPAESEGAPPPQVTVSDALPEEPVPSSEPAGDITSSDRSTTLTISETKTSTITSCPPEAETDCPEKIGSETVIVDVTTTVCPVTDVPTVITVSKTITDTIVSCAPDVVDCPNEPTTVVEEEVITTTTPVAVTDEPEPTPEEPPAEEFPVEEPSVDEPAPEESQPPAPDAPVEEPPVEDVKPEQPGEEASAEVPQAPQESQPPAPAPEQPDYEQPESPAQSQPPAPETPTEEQPPVEYPEEEVPVEEEKPEQPPTYPPPVEEEEELVEAPPEDEPALPIEETSSFVTTFAPPEPTDVVDEPVVVDAATRPGVGGLTLVLGAAVGVVAFVM